MSDFSLGNAAAGAAVAGVIGIALIGFQQGQKEDASNTANLPATNKQVENNRNEINKIREKLDSALKTLEDDTNAQIDRRELEMTKYVDTLDDKKRQRVDGLEGRLQRVESMLFNHVNTPPSEHSP